MSPVVSRGLAQLSLEDPEHMRTLAEQAAEDLADAPAGRDSRRAHACGRRLRMVGAGGG